MERVEEIVSGFALDPSQATNVNNTSPKKNLTTLNNLMFSNNFDPFLKHELKH